ncbi:MAG: class I adenylate-forming enzyme family protein [Bacillota bacterium]|nr:class I adenylate-forming enzyme family protein [Bacillota bacterium]
MNIEKTIYEVIRENALNNKEGIAYDFLDYTRTYIEFLEDIDRCARYLNDMGINKGDIVSLYLPNIPRALVLYYAINKIGGISNFIHPNMPVNENKDMLLKMQPKAIFLLDSMYEKLKQFRENNIISKYIIVKASENLPRKYKAIYGIKEKYYNSKIKFDDNVVYYNDNDLDINDVEIHTDYNDVATILFTGGTTGNIKGVCLSSKNMNASAYQTGTYRIENDKSDKMLAILPVFHGYGLVNCIHTTFFESATIILLPYFKEKLFKDTIIKKKPDYMLGIPMLYSKMADLFKNEEIDLSFFKGLYCGGSKLSETILQKVNHVLVEKKSKVQLREGYGLSECVGACTLMPENKFKIGSVGMPYEGVEVKICDVHTGEKLENNKIGEICVQSDTVMLGYFGEKSDNIKSENGVKWLFTGDIGYMDDEGYIFFVDRIKRMIKILGHEVYPLKVESCINSIENVVNSCVVEMEKDSIPYLKAYIVLENKLRKKRTTKKIMNICEKNLPRWSIPREIEFVKHIPETLLKKNDYKKLS